MFRVFDGTTADDVWLKLAAAFREESLPLQESRAGVMREIPHAAISISNPRRRWVVSRAPALNPAFALAEVVWILAGRNDAAFLNYFNSKLPNFAGAGGHYHGAYGYRLRTHLGMDQLNRAYDVLRHNPSSRQVVLQIWDARSDLPTERGLPVADDIPCNVLAMLKVRDGRLEWTQILRSNDLFLGVPHNLVQFTALQEIMAGWLGMEVGAFNALSDSLHVYERDREVIAAARPVFVADYEESLALPKHDSEQAIQTIAVAVDKMREGVSQIADMGYLVNAAGLPEPFANVLRVLAAESERRCARPDNAKRVMSNCTNATYVELWQRWEHRVIGQRIERIGQND
jgi:thymidylate synthase